MKNQTHNLLHRNFKEISILLRETLNVFRFEGIDPSKQYAKVTLRRRSILNKIDANLSKLNGGLSLLYFKNKAKRTARRKRSLSISKGFTLSEIIVVVIILGAIASFALPRFTGTFERVRSAEGVQILTALLGAQKTFKWETGSYATDVNDLDVAIDRANNFVVPPTVDNPPDPINDPIAEIRRTNAYWLEINEEGTVTCRAAAPNAFTCAQAGY